MYLPIPPCFSDGTSGGELEHLCPVERFAEPRQDGRCLPAEVAWRSSLEHHRHVVPGDEDAARSTAPDPPDVLHRASAHGWIVGHVRRERQDLSPVLRCVTGKNDVAILA